FGSVQSVRDEHIGNVLQVGTAEQMRTGAAGFFTTTKADRFRTATLPDLPDIPLVGETMQILNEPSWPPTLQMSYAAPAPGTAQGSPLDRMAVWRYLGRDDLKDAANRIKRYNALALNSASRRRLDPKSVELVEYLTADGWPERFLYAYTPISRLDLCFNLD